MASVASQLIEEVTAHAQSDSLEDAREMCADGTYFPNNLRTLGCDVIFASEAGVYPLLLLPRGTARAVILPHTMAVSC